MIGLVLVTHGRLADEFKAALEHVMGPQKQIEAVTIGAEDDADLCRSDIIEAVNRVDSGDGVAILTDMFGGTPSNLAISCMSRPKVEVLAGINLPMLVKLAKVREERVASRRHRAWPRKPAANTSPSPAGFSPANERRRRGARRRCRAECPAGRGVPRTSHHQQARPARARLGEIRPDGRALQRRGLGDPRRRNRRRHLDHGTDDAVGRDRAHPSSSPRSAPRRRPPSTRSPNWSPASSTKKACERPSFSGRARNAAAEFEIRGSSSHPPAE